MPTTVNVKSHNFSNEDVHLDLDHDILMGVHSKLVLGFAGEAEIKSLEVKAQAASNPISKPAAVLCGALQDAIATISLPFRLSLIGAQHKRYLQLNTAARIRRLTPHDRDNPPSAEEMKKRDLEAFVEASSQLGNEINESKGKQYIIEAALLDLNDRINDDEFRRAASVLLKQGIVLTWSAFECFARDSIRAYLNSHPSIATNLAAKSELRGMFHAKGIAFADVENFGFDLSSKMGDILLTQSGLNKLPDIRTVFAALIDFDNLLALNSDEMWMLAQRRHLIVHNGGIIDEEYLSKTPDKGSVGEVINISPGEVTEYMSRVIESASQIFTGLTIRS